MREFFRHYVLHNLGLKLISLGLAVGLWLAVARDPAPAEVVVELPIEFHHVWIIWRSARKAFRRHRSGCGDRKQQFAACNLPTSTRRSISAASVRVNALLI